MTSKFPPQTEVAPISEFEGAITSAANIRPDEIILRNFGEANPTISITLISGKKIDLPLRIHSDNEKIATLVISEKFYKESETDLEFKNLLEGLFDNQRMLEIELIKEKNRIIIQPLDNKTKFKIIFNR